MKLPCIHFYPGDWLRDQVSGCSLAAQGLWLRMMMLAHDTDRYGYLSMNGVALRPEHIAARCGIPLDLYTTLLAELDSVGVPRRTPDGVIYSKRMAEDARLRAERSKAGRKGGKQNRSKEPSKPKASPEGEDEVELPESLRTEAFRAAWLDWIAYKRERREKYKPRGAKAALAALAEIGPERAVKAIRFSISKNWAGIFEERNGGTNRQNPARFEGDPNEF